MEPGLEQVTREQVVHWAQPGPPLSPVPSAPYLPPAPQSWHEVSAKGPAPPKPRELEVASGQIPFDSQNQGFGFDVRRATPLRLCVPCVLSAHND